MKEVPRAIAMWVAGSRWCPWDCSSTPASGETCLPGWHTAEGLTSLRGGFWQGKSSVLVSAVGDKPGAAHVTGWVPPQHPTVTSVDFWSHWKWQRGPQCDRAAANASNPCRTGSSTTDVPMAKHLRVSATLAHPPPRGSSLYSRCLGMRMDSLL